MTGAFKCERRRISAETPDSLQPSLHWLWARGLDAMPRRYCWQGRWGPLLFSAVPE